MSREHFLPKDDPGKCAWVTNFAAKMAVHGPLTGFSVIELTGIANDAAYFVWLCDCQNRYKSRAATWTAFKNLMRDTEGAPDDGPPAAPVLEPMPDPVAPGIFRRMLRHVGRIKKHPNYTEALGADLDIIGAEQVFDPATAQPAIQLRLSAGHPEVLWSKGPFDGVEIEVDRGGGWVFLAVDTVPDYVDTAPLPAAGQGATWRYRAIYRLGDERTGQWSNVAVIAVMG